jgi:zinc/manganese transport system substrate-binding protein
VDSWIARRSWTCWRSPQPRSIARWATSTPAGTHITCSTRARAAERVAVGIGKRLSELDPEGSAAYLEQTRQFLESLRRARAGWEKRLEKLRGRKVIAYHRSLAYLASWARLDVRDHIESKPGVPPEPRHVAELIANATQNQIRLVLQESWYPTSTSELVAKKLGGRLLRLPSATNFQAGQSYLTFLEQIVKLLEGAA